ncbi:hypothetical protein KIM67_01860 [Flagellimonas sp. 389]|uniref:DUF6973 domain-containing protein n=1 Tax=Flagellimonas sp. 389 TaxID=2835862 RepID=UPI001BD48854|nr:hypothetical protein [Flagellimonas sp. 389]MBS9461139.1 hypothetical protein [Flagellimonas sp. 389]
MNPIRALKRLDSKSIWVLIKLCIKSPLFVLPTVKATKQCMAVSTQHYGRLHYKNGPANAFRHALWNYLISKRCYDLIKNKAKVLRWSQNITDWHEDAFPNRELARKMDLHNNAVGRYVFEKHKNNTVEEAIKVLTEMTKVSSKVDSNCNFANFRNKLVHIINEE